jgi:hypothetical protein
MQSPPSPPPTPTVGDKEAAQAAGTVLAESDVAPVVGELAPVDAAAGAENEAADPPPAPAAEEEEEEVMTDLRAHREFEGAAAAPVASHGGSAGASAEESAESPSASASNSTLMPAATPGREKSPVQPWQRGRPLINWKHDFSKTHHKVTTVPHHRVSLIPAREGGLDTTFYGIKTHCVSPSYSFWGFGQDPDVIASQPIDMEWGGWFKRLLRCSWIKSFSFGGAATHKDVGVESTMAKRRRMREKQRAHMQAHTNQVGAVERAASLTMEAMALAKVTELQSEADGEFDDQHLRERLAKRSSILSQKSSAPVQ